MQAAQGVAQPTPSRAGSRSTRRGSTNAETSTSGNHARALRLPHPGPLTPQPGAQLALAPVELGNCPG
jgi:hypothetical protein